MARYYYLLWNPRVRRLVECEVLDGVIIIDLGDFWVVYYANTDRLIVRLPLLEILAGAPEPAYLDLEAVPTTHLFNALEQLLRESIVLYEEVEE